jgi:hypothetical protein
LPQNWDEKQKVLLTLLPHAGSDIINDLHSLEANAADKELRCYESQQKEIPN